LPLLGRRLLVSSQQ